MIFLLVRVGIDPNALLVTYISSSCITREGPACNCEGAVLKFSTRYHLCFLSYFIFVRYKILNGLYHLRATTVFYPKVFRLMVRILLTVYYLEFEFNYILHSS